MSRDSRDARLPPGEDGPAADTPGGHKLLEPGLPGRGLPVVALHCPIAPLRSMALDRLHAAGYATWATGDASRLLETLQARECHVVAVHCEAGQPSAGIHVIQRISAIERVWGFGILAIQEEDSPSGRALALDAGANLNISADLDPAELSAAVSSLLRIRQEPQAPLPRQSDPTIPWHLDSTRRVLASPSGIEINLTALEHDLLLCLMRSKNQLITKSELLELLYPDQSDLEDAHRIDMLVSRLRSKVLDTGNRLPLRSIFGKGLVFVDKSE
jgi:two-component system response regulator PhoP